MGEVKYEGFRLGKTTEIIAKTLRVTWIIVGVLFLIELGSMVYKAYNIVDYVIIYQNPIGVSNDICYKGENVVLARGDLKIQDRIEQGAYEKKYGERACENRVKYVQWLQKNEYITITINTIIFIVIFIISFFILFKYLIGFHKTLQLFKRGEIDVLHFKKSRRNCLISAILLNVLSFIIFLITSKVLLFIGAILTLASLFIMIPQYIFLAKTKSILLHEAKETNDNNNNKGNEEFIKHIPDSRKKIDNFHLDKINTDENFSKLRLKMSNNEIIVASIVVGTIIALILGFVFCNYYKFTGKGMKVYVPYDETIRQLYSEFNYLLGLGGFIISSGVTYLVLKRKMNKQ